MPKYKQGKKARMAESKGMKDYMHGYAKGANERYMPKGMGDKIMGHASKPMGIDAMASKRQEMGKIDHSDYEYKGHDHKAFDYEF